MPYLQGEPPSSLKNRENQGSGQSFVTAIRGSGRGTRNRRVRISVLVLVDMKDASWSCAAIVAVTASRSPAMCIQRMRGLCQRHVILTAVLDSQQTFWLLTQLARTSILEIFLTSCPIHTISTLPTTATHLRVTCNRVTHLRATRNRTILLRHHNTVKRLQVMDHPIVPIHSAHRSMGAFR